MLTFLRIAVTAHLPDGVDAANRHDIGCVGAGRDRAFALGGLFVRGALGSHAVSWVLEAVSY